MFREVNRDKRDQDVHEGGLSKGEALRQEGGRRNVCKAKGSFKNSSPELELISHKNRSWAVSKHRFKTHV